MIYFVLILIFALSFTPLAPPVNGFLNRNRLSLEKVLIGIAFCSLGLLFFPELQKEAGEWALDLLILLLFLPILGRVFSASVANMLIPYRKGLGILMGMLAFAHVSLYLFAPLLAGSTFTLFPWETPFWISGDLPSYLGIGFMAFCFSFLLLITSNIYSMKLLGKRWKMLHRTAYLIFFLVYMHVSLIRMNVDIVGTSVFLFFLIGKILEWRKIILIAPKR